MNGKKRYIICHLEKCDCAPNYLRKEWLLPISIEEVSRSGNPIGRSVSIDLETTDVRINGKPVPESVVKAAKALAPGRSATADEHGLPAWQWW